MVSGTRRSSPTPNDVWEEAAAHYDEEQLSAIVLMIATLDFVNRVDVTVRERADRAGRHS